ncbi:MAG: transglycosylase SLT domain-containing protein [Flavobacteriales bacterium]|nr:transglycosylase SLT domain-containing protein [Flavobacteriales bacterium]
MARDLRRIRKDTLRVLVLSDPLTWEQRPGAMTGLEWELLERFAKRQRLHIKAVPVADRDSMLVMLPRRPRRCDRGTAYHRWLDGSLHAPDPALSPCRGMYARPRTARPGSSDQGSADTLAVSAWSPFLDSLQLSTAVDSGVVLHIVDQLPEELLARSAMGKVPVVLVSDALADMEAKRLPLVEFGPRLGKSVPLVFAVRTNADHLLHALDTWLAVASEREARKSIITAYENGLDTCGTIRSFSALAFGGDTISPYDSLFQVHADSLSWDWRLLAAVAFKESRFDTTALSYAGAGGLMQMMPTTALRMGVTAEGGLNGHIEELRAICTGWTASG